MSENPFESPTAETGTNLQPSQSMPTTALILCILCLVFGVFGLFGICASGGVLFGADALAKVMPPEAREQFMEGISLQFVPLVTQIVLGVIFAPLMVTACIGCFVRKPWGRKLLIFSCLGFALWNIVSAGTAVWLTVFHIETLAAPNVPTMGNAAAVQMAYAGQAFGIVLSLAFMVFYAFAAWYMTREKVVDFFEPAT